VTAAIQLSYLGTHGLREVATRCAQGARYAYDQIVQLDGVRAISDQPFFREFAVETSAAADVVLTRLVAEGFLGGLSANSLTGSSDGSLANPEHTLLISVTEKRTKAEIDAFVAALAKAVK
jgi:glycine dehydrogenase subunit 1